MKTVTKVRYSMTLTKLKKALEEIGFNVKICPGSEKEVPYLEVWK